MQDTHLRELHIYSPFAELGSEPAMYSEHFSACVSRNRNTGLEKKKTFAWIGIKIKIYKGLLDNTVQWFHISVNTIKAWKYSHASVATSTTVLNQTCRTCLNVIESLGQNIWLRGLRRTNFHIFRSRSPLSFSAEIGYIPINNTLLQ